MFSLIASIATMSRTNSHVVVGNIVSLPSHFLATTIYFRSQYLQAKLYHRSNVAFPVLQVDEQKAAQPKLYSLGGQVALDQDDSDVNVIQRSRKLFRDAAPSFMNDYGLWIFSRSLVKKGYNGKIGDALDFGSYDPLESLKELPSDPSSGVRCAEIFLFFAVDGDVPGDDLSSREAVIAFLNALNTNEGTRKIHAFTVIAGSVIAPREKLHDLSGKHLTA